MGQILYLVAFLQVPEIIRCDFETVAKILLGTTTHVQLLAEACEHYAGRQLPNSAFT
jgi:hypothetical protein